MKFLILMVFLLSFGLLGQQGNLGGSLADGALPVSIIKNISGGSQALLNGGPVVVFAASVVNVGPGSYLVTYSGFGLVDPSVGSPTSGYAEMRLLVDSVIKSSSNSPLASIQPVADHWRGSMSGSYLFTTAVSVEVKVDMSITSTGATTVINEAVNGIDYNIIRVR